MSRTKPPPFARGRRRQLHHPQRQRQHPRQHTRRRTPRPRNPENSRQHAHRDDPSTPRHPPPKAAQPSTTTHTGRGPRALTEQTRFAMVARTYSAPITNDKSTTQRNRYLHRIVTNARSLNADLLPWKKSLRRDVPENRVGLRGRPQCNLAPRPRRPPPSQRVTAPTRRAAGGGGAVRKKSARSPAVTRSSRQRPTPQIPRLCRSGALFHRISTMVGNHGSPAGKFPWYF
jgi:hypothetical protein